MTLPAFEAAQKLEKRLNTTFENISRQKIKLRRQ